MRLLFTHVILCIFILRATPQINSCYSYAEGNTQGVTITWDAYTLNNYDEILGCNIYKRISWNDSLIQLNEELITSLDSNYFYFDTGNFIGTFPPCYVLEAVTGYDTCTINGCSALLFINFEVIDPENVLLQALPWDTAYCIPGVNVYLNDILVGFTGYDSIFECNIDINFLGPGNYLRFEFLSEWGIYQDLKVTYEYLWNVSQIVHVPIIRRNVELNQNYPNPFNGHTTISFYIDKKSPTRLEIFDIKGDLIKMIEYGYLNPGQYYYKLNINELSPGHYFYRLITNSEVVCKKMIKE